MACTSTITATYSGTQLQHVQFCCSGQCPTGAPCCVQVSYTPQGAVRAWCGCGPTEPEQCHIVLFRPSSTAPTEFICAGTCPTTSEKCVLKKTVQGNSIVYSCECAKG